MDIGYSFRDNNSYFENAMPLLKGGILGSTATSPFYFDHTPSTTFDFLNLEFGFEANFFELAVESITNYVKSMLSPVLDKKSNFETNEK